MADGYSTPTQTDSYDVVARLLQSLMPQLGAGVVPATMAGVSRTTLGQLTDPNIIAGTGVLDQWSLGQMLDQYISSMQQEAQKAADEEYQQKVDDWTRQFSAINKRYSLEPPKFYENVTPRWQSSAQGGTGKVTVPVGQIANSLFELATQNGGDAAVAYLENAQLNANEWQQFGLSPTQATDNVAKGMTLQAWLTDQSNPNKITASGVAGLKNDIKNYASAYNTYAIKKMEYQDNLATNQRNLEADLLALGDQPQAPTMSFDQTKAMRDFYNEIGVPGLAMLPDPRATYDIPLSEIKKMYWGGDTAKKEAQLAALQKEVQSLRPAGADYAGTSQVPAAKPLSKKEQQNLSRKEQLLRETEALLAKNKSRYEQSLAYKGQTPFSDAFNQLLRYGILEAGN